MMDPCPRSVPSIDLSESLWDPLSASKEGALVLFVHISPNQENSWDAASFRTSLGTVDGLWMDCGWHYDPLFLEVTYVCFSR